MTVAELLARISSAELGEWMEWYRRRDAEAARAAQPQSRPRLGGLA